VDEDQHQQTSVQSRSGVPQNESLIAYRRTQIVFQMNRLAAHFPTHRQGEDWEMMLEDFSRSLARFETSDVEAVIDQHLERGEFFPKLKDLIEPLEKKAGYRARLLRLEKAGKEQMLQLSTSEFIDRHGVEKFRQLHLEHHGVYPNEEKLQAHLKSRKDPA